MWTPNEIDSNFYKLNALPPHFGEVTQFCGYSEFRVPLWYPALIFAFAGVGILRVGRFTLRSALIATTVVAKLLGMAVIRQEASTAAVRMPDMSEHTGPE